MPLLWMDPLVAVLIRYSQIDGPAALTSSSASKIVMPFSAFHTFFPYYVLYYNTSAIPSRPAFPVDISHRTTLQQWLTTPALPCPGSREANNTHATFKATMNPHKLPRLRK